MFRARALSVPAADELPIDSEDLNLPIRENIDSGILSEVDTSGIFGEADGLETLDSDGYCEVPSDPPVELTESESVLSASEHSNLGSMISDNCLSTKAVFKFKMPWERPELKAILDSSPKPLIPVPVMQPSSLESLGIASVPGNPLPSG